MLHYHLDRFVVHSGQSVKKGSLLGYTGMTGKATGIHLHLGIKSLSGGSFIDPEAWSANEFEKLTKPKYSPGNYKVNTSVLNVREGPGTKCKVKPFTKLTKSAQSKIKKLSGKAVNGYDLVHDFKKFLSLGFLLAEAVFDIRKCFLLHFLAPPLL